MRSTAEPVTRSLPVSPRDRLARLDAPDRSEPDGLPPPETVAFEVLECDVDKPVAGASSSRPGGLRAVMDARARRVVAVLAVVAVVVAAFVAWRAWPRPEPVSVVAELADGSAAGPVGGGASAAVLVVSVVGDVREPGLVEVPAGSRVADAIEAAGGLTQGADVGFLNLARKVVDGELIVVGAASAEAGAGMGGDGAAGAGAPVNLNAATMADLDGLPGVGPVLAQRIVDYRTANGGFASVEELREVDGIGEGRFAELKDLVAV